MKQLILQHKYDIIKIALILLWGIGCFWFFETEYKYHFFYEEQDQLFILDSEYLSHYFTKPAWLGCLAGDFLTQFYHYLYLGALILTGALLCLGDILRRNLEKRMGGMIPQRASTIAASFIATFIALVFITYQARLCLDENYRLSHIICIIGGAMIWYGHNILGNWLKKWWGRILLFFITQAITYWMFGGLGLAVCVFFELLSKQFILSTIAAAVFIAAIIYVIAPYYNITTEVALKYPGMGRIAELEDVRIAERTLQLDNEYYFGHYAYVVDLYETKADEVTDMMTFYYCLSLAQMGSLPEKMVTLKKPYLGTFETIGSETPMFVINMIHDLYWAIGDMTYTERAALLSNTFSRSGRNVRMIKRIAEANLVNGDTAAANKYLRLLGKSLIYKDWAEEHTPGQFSVPVKMEIEKKQQFINTTNSIRLGDSCYTILTQLLDSNPDNLVALNYLLCSDMLSKEKDTFIRDYEKYDGGRVPFFQQIYNSAKQ